VPEASIKCAAVRAYAATAVDRSVHRVVLVKIALFKYVLEVQTLFPGSLQHPCPHPTGSAELSSNPSLPAHDATSFSVSYMMLCMHVVMIFNGVHRAKRL
jgi:hypothetical protein